MNIVNKIKLKSTIVAMQSDEIMYFFVKPNIDYVLEDAQEAVEAAGKIGNKNRYLNLIILGEGTLPEKEVREYVASEEGSKYTLAAAFVLTSLPQKLLGNVYLKINKPVKLSRIFNNKEDALAWLKSLKNH